MKSTRPSRVSLSTEVVQIFQENEQHNNDGVVMMMLITTLIMVMITMMVMMTIIIKQRSRLATSHALPFVVVASRLHSANKGNTTQHNNT